MHKTKLTIFLAVISFVLFGTAGVASAANIYVDSTLAADCVSANYSIANRVCSGTNGNAYNTIQKALNNMSIGDTIYMRGGIYREDNGNTNYAEIVIPSSKNGNSWELGHFNTLTSYPGEWAIIDGEGNAPGGVVLGLRGMTYCPTCVLRYWKFERFEITGGNLIGNSSGGAGLWLPEGPFIIRYLFVHDNWDDSQLNNPAGIVFYRLQNSIIEYNYFYRNGCNDGGNCRQIAIFNDYCEESTQSQCQNPPFNNTVNDLNRATRGNVIRYNLFDGGPTMAHTGLGYKSTQLLDPNDGSGWTNKTLGDRVHHNIFLNHSSKPVKLSQDYLQFYNNIMTGNLAISEYNQNYRLKTTVYNNTILSGSLQAFSAASGSQADEPFRPWDYVYNNIIDNSPSNGNESRAINYWPYTDGVCTNIDTSHLDIDRNYIYRPQNSVHIYISGKTLCGSQYGQLNVNSFNGYYGKSNYYKASSEGMDNLMMGSSGGDAYIARAGHVISGTTTVGNAGIGGPHPYLSGVTIPSYIGATNPNDNAWVVGVLGLANAATLQAGTASAPSWIEGSGAVSDTTPPSAPMGLAVK